MRFSLLIISGILFCTQFSYAQCFPERHSTNWYDGWMSCSTAPNPNSARAMSHWIMYDLENLYELNRTHIWNHNEPGNLGSGVREVAVDYSLDGSTWTAVGIFTIGQANGLPTYEGEAGPNLGGVEARYVLLTALSNYGADCFSLGEIRIEAEEVNVSVSDQNEANVCLKVDVFPNPVKDIARVYVESSCQGEIAYQLFDLLGKQINNGDVTEIVDEKGYFSLNASGLNSGEYVLEIQNQEGVIRKTILKL